MRKRLLEPCGAKMKHATSRMLFAYWDAIRGERAAPDRRDVQPSGMRHVLADTFMLETGPDRAAMFRLAGTRVCALFCRDLRGSAFGRVWGRETAPEIVRLLDLVRVETVGALVGIAGRNENGSALSLELLLLPLKHRGRTEARVLGALSPSSIPSWAGLVPLAALEIGTVRMIEPARETSTEDRSGAPRRRNLFVVHEGGLA